MRPRTPWREGIAIALRTESAERCVPTSGVVVCARAPDEGAVAAKTTSASGIRTPPSTRPRGAGDAAAAARRILLPVEFGVWLSLGPRVVRERVADALDERRMGVDE